MGIFCRGSPLNVLSIFGKYAFNRTYLHVANWIGELVSFVNRWVSHELLVLKVVKTKLSQYAVVATAFVPLGELFVKKSLVFVNVFEVPVIEKPIVSVVAISFGSLGGLSKKF